MRTTAGLCLAVSPWAFLPTGAFAQAVTETESYGERYEFVETQEFGEGTTSYTATAEAQINGQAVPIDMPELFSYTPIPVGQVSAALPGPFVHDIGGAEVTITAWAPPTLFDSETEIVDVFISESYTSSIITVTTVQLTSGDADGAFVPFGSRGYCSGDGTDGATNFAPFDGSFADCEYSEDQFEVAPGTVNRNTHTTSIYRDEYYRFESYDSRVIDRYLVGPSASTSTSTGTLATTVSTTVTQRHDSFATELVGMFDGVQVFGETVDGTIDGNPAQAALGRLTQPTGMSADGHAAVLTWSSPTLTGSTEALVGSSAVTTTEVSNATVVTVTELTGTGAGEFVTIGERGQCTATGVSGEVGPGAGAFAQCEGGIDYTLSAGETHTNTHTTQVTNVLETTLVTEDWLNTSSYRLTATATLVGQVHAAVRELLAHQIGGLFGNAANELPHIPDRPLAAWLDVARSGLERDATTAGPGFRIRDERFEAGLGGRLGPSLVAGVSFSWADGTLDMAGSGERASTDSRIATAQLHWAKGPWDVRAVVASAWSDIDTVRAGIGPLAASEASYDATSRMIGSRLSRQLGSSSLGLSAFVLGDWMHSTVEDFRENGGLALAARRQSAERGRLGAGLSLDKGIAIAPALDLTVTGKALAGFVTGDSYHASDVAFTTAPDQTLAVTTARSPGEFAMLDLGARLRIGRRLTIHAGGNGLVARGQDAWQVRAGVGLAF